MLQSIRNNAQGIFVWVIVGLIIISFALFGLGSYLSGASKVDAASVNGVDINDAQLTRAYQNYQERLMQMFGDQYRPEMFNEARLKAEVLQGLITEEVLNQAMHSQKYVASPKQIIDQLKKYEAFQEAGVFSAIRYKEALALQGINGEAFERDIGRDIAARQIKEAITTSAFLTEAEQKSVALLQNQQREIGYFEVSAKPYLRSAKISDEEIKSYYENNSNLYLTPEKVQLEYLELTMDNVANMQDVTDDMILQQYESSPESYQQADVDSAKKQADSIAKQIKQGLDFATLAKKYSQDTGSAKQGGDLGYLTRGVSDTFDKTVFSLKKGEVSSVIKTKSGFQIIKLDDIRAGDPEERKVSHILIKVEKKLKPFNMVKNEIKKELKYQIAGKVFLDDADKLNNLSYETPDTLEPVADALGLKVQTSALFTRNGGDGIFANPKIINAAFSQEVLKDGHNSEIIELSDTHLMVVRVKQHQPASVQPLHNVKTQIKEHLAQDYGNKKVQEVTAEVLRKLKVNPDIKQIQKDYPEMTWHKIGLIKRDTDKKSDLPVAVRQHAFSMARPSGTAVSWDSVILSANSQAILAVYKVVNDNASKFDKERIEQIIGDSDYKSYVEFLKSEADISVYHQTGTE